MKTTFLFFSLLTFSLFRSSAQNDLQLRYIKMSSHYPEALTPVQPNDEFLAAQCFSESSFNAQNNHCIKSSLDLHVLDSVVYPYNYKFFYVFNTNGNILYDIKYIWGSTSGSWVPKDKYEYIYNDEGENTKMTRYTYSSSSWFASYSYDYSYNDIHQLILSIRSKTDVPEITPLVPDEKKEYLYDNMGNLERINKYYWEGNNWSSTYHKILYEYDAFSNMISETTYSFDPYNGWKVYLQNTFEYDGYHNLTGKVHSVSSDGSTIFDYFKGGYEYDAFNNLILSEEYSREPFTGITWIGSSKSENECDAHGNILQSIKYTWSNGWVPVEKYESTLDFSYDLSDMLVPVKYKMNNMIKLRSTYKMSSGDWVFDQHEIFYYSGSFTSVDYQPITEIKIYPNPVSDNLFIKTNDENSRCTLMLFDINGNRMLTHVFNGNGHFKLKDQTPGIYLYRICQDNKTYSGKLVIR